MNRSYADARRGTPSNAEQSLHETEASPRGIIVQGVDVIEATPHTLTQGRAVFERSPHTDSQGTTSIEQHPRTFTLGIDSIEPGVKEG